MIVAAALCPHPPLLFRELTGAYDVAGDLRAACLSVVASITAGPVDRVLVVGGAGVAQVWEPTLEPDVAGFAARTPSAAPGLPLSLGVGKRLLGEAGWLGPLTLTSVAWDASATALRAVAHDLENIAGRNALLVLGDGSACRGDKAPGYLDERAFEYDAQTARALAKGDPATLRDQDADLAAELLVAGRAAFAVLADVAAARGGPARAELVYEDDPHGVMYYVALWEL